jgi:hypothetical protein
MISGTKSTDKNVTYLMQANLTIFRLVSPVMIFHAVHLDAPPASTPPPQSRIVPRRRHEPGRHGWFYKPVCTACSGNGSEVKFFIQFPASFPCAEAVVAEVPCCHN